MTISRPTALLLIGLATGRLAFGQSDTTAAADGLRSGLPARLAPPRDSLADRKLNDSLKYVLQSIGYDDEKYRNEMEGINAKYGRNSKEMTALLKKMGATDSVDILRVTAIIDRYGWLGPDRVGAEAGNTLFMVVQHADSKIQEKYLPVMEEAVRNGRAKASDLALLEDRVALKQGKKQLYGSQLSWNMKTNTLVVLPLEDPDNVDKRRASMGLGPLAGYLAECCNLTWDLEKYKKANAVPAGAH